MGAKCIKGRAHTCGIRQERLQERALGRARKEPAWSTLRRGWTGRSAAHMDAGRSALQRAWMLAGALYGPHGCWQERSAACMDP
eukprot:359869-Chlamydomonas_euryale.AAC.22